MAFTQFMSFFAMLFTHLSHRLIFVSVETIWSMKSKKKISIPDRYVFRTIHREQVGHLAFKICKRLTTAIIKCSEDSPSHKILNDMQLSVFFLQRAKQFCSDGVIEVNNTEKVNTTNGATLSSDNVLSCMCSNTIRLLEK